jgi:predicted nucleotide-binding protein (sugar kinase/HSP70/actin superfamily)
MPKFLKACCYSMLLALILLISCKSSSNASFEKHRAAEFKKYEREQKKKRKATKKAFKRHRKNQSKPMRKQMKKDLKKLRRDRKRNSRKYG